MYFVLPCWLFLGLDVSLSTTSHVQYAPPPLDHLPIFRLRSFPSSSFLLFHSQRSGRHHRPPPHLSHHLWYLSLPISPCSSFVLCLVVSLKNISFTTSSFLKRVIVGLLVRCGRVIDLRVPRRAVRRPGLPAGLWRLRVQREPRHRQPRVLGPLQHARPHDLFAAQLHLPQPHPRHTALLLPCVDVRICGAETRDLNVFRQ